MTVRLVLILVLGSLEVRVFDYMYRDIGGFSFESRLVLLLFFLVRYKKLKLNVN